MSEPATLQPDLAPPLPVPAGEPGMPCERCGGFIEGKPWKIGERSHCESCGRLLRERIRLYPVWYVFTWGLVTNFLMAAILCAINWKRLGDRERMRNASIIAVCGGAWCVFAFARQINAGTPIVHIFNIIGTAVAAQALKGAYDQHKQQGGSRANLLWPLVITLGVILLLAVAIATYESVTGQTLAL